MSRNDDGLFVGIDAGTTGVTVAFVDATGETVAGGYREYSCRTPHPGWVEQDVDEVWLGICAACRAAASSFLVMLFSPARSLRTSISETAAPAVPGQASAIADWVS